MSRPEPRSLPALALGNGLLAPGFARAADAPPASADLPTTALLALLLVAAALALVLLGRAAWRLAHELRDERAQRQAVDALLDAWQWRSGPDHRLQLWRPPAGSPAAAWQKRPSARLLWEHFGGDDVPALRACVDAHAPIEPLQALVSLGDAGNVVCELRGQPLRDGEGRFSGYVGLARPLAGASPNGGETRPGDSVIGAEERDSFAYTVSHDLRAPIRVVEGFTKILKEDYGHLLDRIGNDHLDRVLGAAARMNSMIDALLALSQLSSQPLQRQPVNLSQLATFIADDLRRSDPNRQVRFHIEPNLQVQGDPTLLRVVLENLLGNAWKYTARQREPHIWFGHEPAQRGDVFTVRDNGAGFDMRFADRLFGVFQRLHSANDFAGTGVGLASVRRIVRRHGGDIWAEAEVDHGASFHFSLTNAQRGKG